MFRKNWQNYTRTHNELAQRVRELGPHPRVYSPEHQEVATTSCGILIPNQLMKRVTFSLREAATWCRSARTRGGSEPARYHQFAHSLCRFGASFHPHLCTFETCIFLYVKQVKNILPLSQNISTFNTVTSQTFLILTTNRKKESIV